MLQPSRHTCRLVTQGAGQCPPPLMPQANHNVHAKPQSRTLQHRPRQRRTASVRNPTGHHRSSSHSQSGGRQGGQAGPTTARIPSSLWIPVSDPSWPLQPQPQQRRPSRTSHALSTPQLSSSSQVSGHARVLRRRPPLGHTGLLHLVTQGEINAPVFIYLRRPTPAPAAATAAQLHHIMGLLTR